jgi:hypothetical protein
MRSFLLLLGLVTAAVAPAWARDAPFGTPPSGQIPILYNNHTVYAKPDVLKQSRVLAASVQNGQMYVPLKAMFEQMGATVTGSPDGKTYTVARGDVSASVTLGRSEVIVNGSSRPLDVPPIRLHGIVLVTVRVLSEALGAYVEWVPEKRLVVVRYIPPTPPPAPTGTPSAMPSVAPQPTLTPQPVRTPAPYIAFVAAALSSRSNYNEFASGQHCNQSYLISAAYAPPNSRWAGKVDFRQDAYVTNSSLTDVRGNQYTTFATIDGGYAAAPVFLGKQSSLDARLEYQIAEPRIYVGLGYLQTTTNYGYPALRGLGVGAEKLPELNPGISYFGSVFYYPNASGSFTVASVGSSNNGTTYRQQYAVTKLDVGLALAFRKFPVFLYGGYSGDEYRAKQNAPIGQTHNGPYLGVGVKI